MLDVVAFRKKYNITQKELCKIMQIRQPYLSAIERGKRPLSKAKYNLLYNHFGNMLAEFYNQMPIFSYNESALEETIRAKEKAEQENEELKAIIESQRETISVLKEYISALKDTNK